MDYDYITHDNVDWRWSSVPIRVFGVDPLVLLIIPLLLATGFALWSSLLAITFAVLLVYIALTTKHGSLGYWLAFQKTRFLQGRKWEVE
jgi:hypothetical protein